MFNVFNVFNAFNKTSEGGTIWVTLTKASKAAVVTDSELPSPT